MKKEIIERFKTYHFKDECFFEINPDYNFNKGFVLKVVFGGASNFEDGSTIIKTPGFELTYHKKDIRNRDCFTDSEKSDRVWIYEKDGFVELLEMKMVFVCPHTKVEREMIVDLVLNKFSIENKEIYFVYNITEMFWVYDNEVVNSNNPFGDVKVINNTIEVDKIVKKWGIAEILSIEEAVHHEKIYKNMAFYSPRGYNTWAGDVVNFYKNGTYHIIYFRDRHHHTSRWGGGAHTMHQIATKDFKTWVEHEEIIKLDEQRKTVGTGTMFYHKGKYYFTHGWHTSRMVPVAKTSRSLFEDPYLKENIESITYEEIYKNNLYPSGATYLVSDDGINFKTSNIQFHISENPSVFVNKDNKLVLYAGYGSDGCWLADDINGPWKKVGNLKMESGNMNPTTECPSMFEQNGYKYLIAGRTGFWMTNKNSDEFYDSAIKGYDIYDGLFVPMATIDDKNRIIYTGWLNGYGWGSLMIHRELFQGDNGRLYMKWLSDLAPTTGELEKIDGFDIQKKTSYYLEIDIKSESDGKIAIKFHGNKNSVLYLDAKEEIIQISNFKNGEKYPKIIAPAYKSVVGGEDIRKLPNIHYDSRNFSIGKADNLVGEFKVKVIIYYEQKFGSYVIDAEIGGKRTIVSNRVDEVFSKISFECDNAEIINSQLYKIKQ